MRSSGSMEIVMMLIICYSEVVPYKYIKSKSCKKKIIRIMVWNMSDKQCFALCFFHVL